MQCFDASMRVVNPAKIHWQAWQVWTYVAVLGRDCYWGKLQVLCLIMFQFLWQLFFIVSYYLPLGLGSAAGLTSEAIQRDFTEEKDLLGWESWLWRFRETVSLCWSSKTEGAGTPCWGCSVKAVTEEHRWTEEPKGSFQTENRWRPLVYQSLSFSFSML